MKSIKKRLEKKGYAITEISNIYSPVMWVVIKHERDGSNSPMYFERLTDIDKFIKDHPTPAEGKKKL